MTKFISPGNIEKKLIWKKNKFLTLVRKNPGISRQDSAIKMSISTYSITKLVPGLIKNGMIFEEKIIAENLKLGKGRPSCPLYINGKYQYFAGIDFEASTWRFVIIDFTGKVIHSEELPFAICKSKEDYNELLKTLLNKSISNIPDIWEKVVALGVGFPGFLNPKTGLIEKYELLPHFENIPLQKICELNSAKPTYLSDNISNLTVYDLWKRPESANKIVLHIAVRSGIASSLSIKGSVFRGSNSKAGEIGLFPVEEGNFLQNIAGISSLKKQLPDLPETFWNGEVKAVNTALKDKKVEFILISAFSSLAKVLCGLSAFINPNEIFIYGTLFSKKNLLRKLLSNIILEYQNKQDFSTVPIRYPENSKMNSAIGSAFYAMEKMYPIQ